MSYKGFNLTTLQLPAPTSNMTKAKYKEAYGIDLDNIDIYKFTLILFGKEKYAIDQIKMVEGGYEIYFNGRILSITDIVQTSDEIYDVSNSKPIYFHPIILSTPSITYKISLVVLNNSPTVYTAQTLYEYFESLLNDELTAVRVPMSGTFQDNSNKDTVASYFVIDANGITLFGANSDAPNASVVYTKSAFLTKYSTCQDGVNKIN